MFPLKFEPPANPDLVHWAEAAFYFSLDLSGDLFGLLFPTTLKADVIRTACRESILENRTHAERTGTPLSLRDLIDKKLTPFGSGYEAFLRFVEHDLVSLVRQKERISPYSSALFNDEINERISERIGSTLKSRSFRDAVYENARESVFRSVLEAGFSIDLALAQDGLSDWDRDIIDRNKELYGLITPLEGLISTLENMEMNRAISIVLETLSLDDQGFIKEICERHDSR